MKILIVEDEIHIARPIKKVLEGEGFLVDYAEDGAEGLEKAAIYSYDLILLDLNLPEVDGISVAKKTRELQDTTPIIMLTARSQVYDKLEGFDSGADDYVTKPFNMGELVARIHAVIKRSSINKDHKLKIAHYELDANTNSIVDQKSLKTIQLSNKEFGILEYLVRNKGTVVSAEKLLEHVWDSEIDMFTETLKTHIKTLRQKVDPKKELIKTIRGKGYIVE